MLQKTRHIVLQLLVCLSTAHPQTIGDLDSLFALAQQSSYPLNSLTLEISSLEERLSQSTLIHRIIPTVNISAFMGTSGIIFIDPEEVEATSFYPPLKDWIGISFSLPINKIFDNGSSTLIKIQLQSKRLEYQKLRTDLRLRLSQKILEKSHLNEQLKQAESELELRRELLDYAVARFNQGDIAFDELASKRLALQAAKSRVARIRYSMALIQMELERMAK